MTTTEDDRGDEPSREDAAGEGAAPREGRATEGDAAAREEGDDGDDDGLVGLVTLFRAWLAGAPLAPPAALLLGLGLPAIVLAANLWHVRSFTIDDAYISFRYARNLARGVGLVYNPGERIEGYTNFLWTVVLAGGIRLGLDPVVLAKALGAGCAFGSLGLTFLLSERLRQFETLPCVATWLLASTVVFTGWSVFGLETASFVFLLLAGTLLFLRETGLGAPQPRGAPVAGGGASAFPWSGVVYALAGLTRPEAPMFVGLSMLFLGRRFFRRQNLLRVALFVGPVAAHVLFRRAYYGTWLPNTLGAKTGNFEGQLGYGVSYLQGYAAQASAVLWLALLGAAMGVAGRRRDLLLVSTLALAVLGYVVLVGGDWMPFFRFLAPFEPFCFLLIDVGARSIVARRSPAANLALGVFGLVIVLQRSVALADAQRSVLTKDRRFWETATGGTARWLLNHAEPGEVALGDIGYVGYATDYPILDLLGLVDPVISKLPGGYTQKLGPGFADRLFSVAPRYVLIISSNVDCQHPSVAGSSVIYRDPRFLRQYAVAGKVPLDQGFAWCIFQRSAR